MTYEELVAKAKKVYGKADASAVVGHLAIQFNVTGEGQGAFYLEVSEGKTDVQPFEYYDRNAIVTVDGEFLSSILDGKLSIDDAFNNGVITVDGDLGSALLLKQIKAKAPAAKKAAAPKKAAPAKKAAAPKKTAAKAAAPKAAEKKEAAPKAAAKTTTAKAAAPKAAAPAKKAAAKKTTK